MSLPKLHFISIISIQNILHYVADLHLKIIIQTQRRKKLLQSRELVGNNYRHSTTCDFTKLSSNWTRDESAQIKIIPHCTTIAKLCYNRK